MARIALVHDIAGVAAVQANLLRSAGHDVDQVRLPAFGASWRWPAKALALPLRLVAYLPTIWKLRRAGYDVIHIHFLSQGVVGLLARRSFFVQAHGSDVHTNLNNAVYRWVTRAVLDRAKAIFYVTPNLRAPLESYRTKLIYLPNPVDVQGLAEGGSPPAALRNVLIFTRLHPVKGVELIFPAVERLSSMVDVTALQIGPLAAEYARRYGHWVKFAKPVAHDEIGRLLHKFDAVIGQMHQGVLGLMEIESLAAGRPLIVAVEPAFYADDPPPVVAASDPASIVAAVERLKGDPTELARLSRLGREWAERNHSYARHLRLLESAYFSSATAE